MGNENENNKQKNPPPEPELKPLKLIKESLDPLKIKDNNGKK